MSNFSLRHDPFTWTLRLWLLEVIVEFGRVRRMSDAGMFTVVIDPPEIMVSLVDPRRFPGD